MGEVAQRKIFVIFLFCYFRQVVTTNDPGLPDSPDRSDLAAAASG